LNLGFIGLGNMGRPMAHNLIKAGYSLVVHDVNSEATGHLVDEGARSVAHASELAPLCDCVLLSLPDDRVVTEVVTGPCGILRELPEGSVICDLSTVGPKTTQLLGDEAAHLGVGYIDAPVSGGISGAQAGALTIMVGGTSETFEQVRPILSVLGKRIIHCGPLGAGNTVKLVNNFISAVCLVGTIEGAVMGVKAGIDPGLLFDVLSTSTARSFHTETSFPNKILPGDFSPSFSLDLMTKDLGLAFDLARELGIRTLGGSIALQTFVEAQSLGLGGLDKSALIQPLERLAGVQVRVEEKRD